MYCAAAGCDDSLQMELRSKEGEAADQELQGLDQEARGAIEHEHPAKRPKLSPSKEPVVIKTCGKFPNAAAQKYYDTECDSVVFLICVDCKALESDMKPKWKLDIVSGSIEF